MTDWAFVPTRIKGRIIRRNPTACSGTEHGKEWSLSAVTILRLIKRRGYETEPISEAESMLPDIKTSWLLSIDLCFNVRHQVVVQAEGVESTEGNSEFCFPETLSVSEAKPRQTLRSKGKQNSLFPAWPVINSFVIPLNSKLEKTAKKLFAWRQLAHKFAAVSRSMTWSRASRKFKLLFPWGVSEFWATARDTFSSKKTENVFELGGIT